MSGSSRTPIERIADAARIAHDRALGRPVVAWDALHARERDVWVTVAESAIAAWVFVQARIIRARGEPPEPG